MHRDFTIPLPSWGPVVIDRGGRTGFSLAEVIIALGIVSFALLASVGLLLHGLQNSRASTDHTYMAVCLETAQTHLKAEGFAHALANASYALEDGALDLLFDSQGVLQTDAAGTPLTTPNADSFYGCLITRHQPTLTQSTSHLLFFQLKFVWPLVAAEPNRQKCITVTSLANDE